ncbi:MAG: matrixin family metalloprotease [Acidimicrobiales bacterium]
MIFAVGAIIAVGCAGDSDGETGSTASVASNPSPADPPATVASEAQEAEGTAGASACSPPDDGGELKDQDFDDHQLPWERNGAEKVVIYFESGGVSEEYRGYLDQGAAAWNRSLCLDVRIIDTCPEGVNCVTVSLTAGDDADGNFDAVEEQDFTRGGHIDLYYEQLDRLGDGAKLNVTIHEMGHAVGLRHRQTRNVLMNGDTYTDIFDPDETDLYNLRLLYGNQE